MRLFVTALLGLALAPLATAQTPCVNGQAGAYACNRVDLAAHLPVSTFATAGSPSPGANSDIWGWTDPMTGNEYALVGSSNGTSFVDVTVPTAPVFLGKLPTASGERIWRDIKVDGDFAFIVSESENHGMQVFDLTRLRSVANPPETFTADALYTGIGKAHNIIVSETADLAVAVGANQGGFACNGGGLHMIDISTPTAPVFAGCYDQAGYTHDAQCGLYDGPDTDHQGKEICVNYNTNRVSFVDVTDPAAPVAIADAFYPDPGYTHQGWFTEDGKYVIVNDEADENGSTGTRTIVLDVADLDNPEFDFFFFGSTTATDHNLYTVGDLVFQSNYSAGLQILTARDIATGTLEEIASFDTTPGGGSGQWSNYPYFASGTVVVNDIGEGFFVLLPDPALAVSSSPTPTASDAVSLSAPVPNPTRDTAELALAVDVAQTVTVGVYDMTGRLVATVYDGAARPDTPVTLSVDASELPAGVYLVRVQGETFERSRMLTLTR